MSTWAYNTECHRVLMHSQASRTEQWQSQVASLQLHQCSILYSSSKSKTAPWLLLETRHRLSSCKIKGCFLLTLKKINSWQRIDTDGWQCEASQLFCLHRIWCDRKWQCPCSRPVTFNLGTDGSQSFNESLDVLVLETAKAGMMELYLLR